MDGFGLNFKAIPKRQKLGNVMFSKFKTQVGSLGEDRCWPWIGAVNSEGYPYYSHFSENNDHTHSLSANRLCYEFFNGVDLRSKRLKNTCGNKSCVNPSHWKLWCESEPSPRMVKGSNHVNAKLHEWQVKDIRASHGQGVTYKQLAEKYNVSFSLIRNIVKRQTWKHV